MRRRLDLWLLLFGLLLPLPLAAQDSVRIKAIAPTQPARLRLFLDCATECDREYLRSEIKIVDWVTDRNASDIYLLATSLRNGAGGNEVALQFIGRGGALEGLTDRHTFQSLPDATDDEFRAEFARVLRLGLVRYLLVANRAAKLSLTDNTDHDAAESRASAKDPWNFWVFNIQLDGQFEGESQQKNTEVELQLNASRITNEWKIELELTGLLRRDEYQLDEGGTFTAAKDQWKTDILVGRSVGPQWSLGVAGTARGARPDNLDLLLRLAPAIEYDLFPYAQAHRRRLILQYSFGINHADYVEETVYDKFKETRLDHRLSVEYRTQQPWGGASLTGTAEAYANALSQNRLGIEGSLSIRLAKGLGLEVEGSYSKVKNQISLPKGDATDEEIFLELRERATNYRAGIAVGISYTFGSFLNTIVNSRFNNVN